MTWGKRCAGNGSSLPSRRGSVAFLPGIMLLGTGTESARVGINGNNDLRVQTESERFRYSGVQTYTRRALEFRYCGQKGIANTRTGDSWAKMLSMVPKRDWNSPFNLGLISRKKSSCPTWKRTTFSSIFLSEFSPAIDYRSNNDLAHSGYKSSRR